MEVVTSRLAVLTYTVRWTTPPNGLYDQSMSDSPRVISIYTYDPGCITFPLVPGKLVAFISKIDMSLKEHTDQMGFKNIKPWACGYSVTLLL